MPKARRLSHKELNGGGPARRMHGALFSLSISRLPAGPAKWSCVVSKKVAPKAHDRNLLKRRCREAVRAELALLRSPLAIVVSAKRAAKDASFALIRKDIEELLRSVRDFSEKKKNAA